MFLFNANTAPNTPRTQIVVLSNMTTPCVSKLSFNKDNITNNKNKELRTKFINRKTISIVLLLALW